MKINSVSLSKKLLVAAISVIVSATGLTKFAANATSVEAATSAPCIITISGIQYDVATLAGAGVHPGGNVFVCGTDMTALFMSMPTHAADIARMTPYIYVAPTATATPTVAPTITPSPVPSSTPAPTVTPTVTPVPSTSPTPTISPTPEHNDEQENEINEVETPEVREVKHEDKKEIHAGETNHGKEVKTVAQKSNHTSDHNKD